MIGKGVAGAYIQLPSTRADFWSRTSRSESTATVRYSSFLLRTFVIAGTVPIYSSQPQQADSRRHRAVVGTLTVGAKGSCDVETVPESALHHRVQSPGRPNPFGAPKTEAGLGRPPYSRHF
jgi:hypothetical protein